MNLLERTQPEPEENSWQYQLDRFVEENQKELAAVAWGFDQDWKDQEMTLGIDLTSVPYFISCSKEALEALNKNVDNKLQEILGLIDGYQPEKEVLMIGIAKNSVKLIYFESNPTPPECFEKFGKDVNELLKKLEAKMVSQIQT